MQVVARNRGAAPAPGSAPAGGAATSRSPRVVVHGDIETARVQGTPPQTRGPRVCVRTTKDNNILRKTNCQVSIYEGRARSSAAEHAPIHLHVNPVHVAARTGGTGTNNEMLVQIAAKGSSGETGENVRGGRSARRMLGKRASGGEKGRDG